MKGVNCSMDEQYTKGDTKLVKSLTCLQCISTWAYISMLRRNHSPSNSDEKAGFIRSKNGKKRGQEKFLNFLTTNGHVMSKDRPSN